MRPVDSKLHLDKVFGDMLVWTPEDAKRFTEGNWMPKSDDEPGVEFVVSFIQPNCCVCGEIASVELTVYQTQSLRRSEGYCAKHLPQIIVLVE